MSTTVHYHNVSAVQLKRDELETNNERKLITLTIKIKGHNGEDHDIVVFGKSKDSWTEATKELSPTMIGEAVVYEHAETNPF